MASRSKRVPSPVKEDGPKREPVSFDIAEAIESGGKDSQKSPERLGEVRPHDEMSSSA